MSRRIGLRLALAGTALILAPRIHAGIDGRSSSLIPIWVSEKAPRNFILDSSRLDSRRLDSLAERLGAKAYYHGESALCYERRRFGRTVYSYCFRADWTPASVDTLVADTNAWSVDSIQLRKGRLFGYYAFAARGYSGWQEDRVSTFLHSAYHQDLYPGYRERDSLFMPMPRQNQLGLWLRGVVSPTWAVYYASPRDPFAGFSRHANWEKIAYLSDGYFTTLAMIAVAAMLTDGKAENRTRVLWLVAGAHTAVSLGVFLPILSMDLGESMRFRLSGYRFPRDLSK
jgi:hypothetical protein